MKYETVLTDPVVKYAERSVGFIAFGENPNNRKHFNWFLPDSIIHGDHTFSVLWHKIPMYTVDRQTTSYAPKAIEWLKEIGALCG